MTKQEHDKAIAEELKKATRRAEELNITELRGMLAFVSGFMSKNYPEVSHALLRIYRPVD